MFSTTLPEVDKYPFLDIEGEVIVIALFHQILYGKMAPLVHKQGIMEPNVMATVSLNLTC